MVNVHEEYVKDMLFFSRKTLEQENDRQDKVK